MANQINNVVYMLSKVIPPQIPKEEYNSPEISIIIPVYNEEKYMNNLLRSIQHQQLKNIEIIFIDDCSTDNSYNLMKEYQNKDKRIKIIKNEINKGILYNRIYGALQAKGNYITFMDADDMYCSLEILKTSLTEAKNNDIDLVEFDYFGGRYDGKESFNTFSVFSNQIKEKYNKVLYQPDI